MAGATPRDHRVNLRLNAEELLELERKREYRGLDVSDYFRTILKEDGHGHGIRT